VKTPSAFGTSPKSDEVYDECAYKVFIVVFGGGGRGSGVVARVESLRGRMSEAGRQVNGLFESLLAESFGN